MTRTSGFFREHSSTTVRHLSKFVIPPRMFTCMTCSPDVGRVEVPSIVGLSRGGKGYSPGSSSACALFLNQNVERRVAALEKISVSCREGIASTGVINKSNIKKVNIRLVRVPVLREGMLVGIQFWKPVMARVSNGSAVQIFIAMEMGFMYRCSAGLYSKRVSIAPVRVVGLIISCWVTPNRLRLTSSGRGWEGHKTRSGIYVAVIRSNVVKLNVHWGRLLRRRLKMAV